MNKSKKIVVALAIVLIGIQFIPTSKNQTKKNPKTDFLVDFKASEEVTAIFKTSCYDCHSNNTYYPWYSKIQPMRFMMDNHVKNGKKDLNFNEFNKYSKRRQKSKLKSIISQLKDNEMPLKSYTIVHKEAKLSASEKVLIIDWIQKIKDSLK